jgi:hypothetical protein
MVFISCVGLSPPGLHYEMLALIVIFSIAPPGQIASAIGIYFLRTYGT